MRLSAAAASLYAVLRIAIWATLFLIIFATMSGCEGSGGPRLPKG